MSYLPADAVRLAFWRALRDLQSEPTLVPAQIPEFDEASGEVTGTIPEAFYEKLAFRVGLLVPDPPKDSGIDID